MTIVLTMIDEAQTPAEFKRCCTLVRDQIRTGEDAYTNSVLVNALMLKFTAMAASTDASNAKAWSALFSGLAKDVMITFHTDPPGMASQGLTVGGLR